MESKAEHEKVAQIVSWLHGCDSYTVEVTYRDGRTATLHNVTDHQWEVLKVEELEYEFIERNVETDAVCGAKLPGQIETLKDVRQFLTHCWEWVGACFNLDMRFAEYTKIDSDNDEQAIDNIVADKYDGLMGKAFAICEKSGVDIYEIALNCKIANAGNAWRIQDSEFPNAEQVRRETFIASCRESDVIHLCAWCRTYTIRGHDDEEHVLIRLEDGEFEATRTTGESHGICEQCKNGQLAACRDMKAEREVSVLKSKFSTVTGQRDFALIELNSANAEILILQNEVEARKSDIEYAENEQHLIHDLLTDMTDRLIVAEAAVNQVKGIVARMKIERDVMQLEVDEARVKLEDAEGK